MIGHSNNENNFPHKLFLTDGQVSRLCKAFANDSAVYIKLLKAQLFQIEQSGGFICRLLGPLLKVGLPLMKNTLKPLAKSPFIPLRLTAAASAADAGIHRKLLGLGMKTLIISIKEMNDIMKRVKSLEKSGLQIKGVSDKIENGGREQKVYLLA